MCYCCKILQVIWSVPIFIYLFIYFNIYLFFAALRLCCLNFIRTTQGFLPRFAVLLCTEFWLTAAPSYEYVHFFGTRFSDAFCAGPIYIQFLWICYLQMLWHEIFTLLILVHKKLTPVKMLAKISYLIRHIWGSILTLESIFNVKIMSHHCCFTFTHNEILKLFGWF